MNEISNDGNKDMLLYDIFSTIIIIANINQSSHRNNENKNKNENKIIDSLKKYYSLIQVSRK